ncbi:hypothetical protein IC608_17910, partial [Devosia sp. PTR5]
NLAEGSTLQSEEFAADCERCFGLCCTALSFQRSGSFGHDKPAGQACHFLEPTFRCGIHAQREQLGYEGCEDFDCFGAGQIASQEFAAQNWRREPAVARRLHARFAELLKVQEISAALHEAGNLGLTGSTEAERRRLLVALRRGEGEKGDADVTINAASRLIEEIGRLQLP